MTLKMGIERKLKEMIPEISEVVQVLWAIFWKSFLRLFA
jgi:Fe-S cluster biogenesis protein NfuA